MNFVNHIKKKTSYKNSHYVMYNIKASYHFYKQIVKKKNIVLKCNISENFDSYDEFINNKKWIEPVYFR